MASPIYTKYLDSKDSFRYVSVGDTAKLIRGALAAAFPGVKFYVRSESYAGGASIDIYYDGLDHFEPHPVFGGDRQIAVYKTGMPSREDVETVAKPFSGQGFDGMIDMAYNKASWLLPDGTAAFGSTNGTEGSRGSDPGYSFPAPHEGAIKVHFGSDYVFVNAELPYDVRSKAVA